MLDTIGSYTFVATLIATPVVAPALGGYTAYKSSKALKNLGEKLRDNQSASRPVLATGQLVTAISRALTLGTLAIGCKLLYFRNHWDTPFMVASELKRYDLGASAVIGTVAVFTAADAIHEVSRGKPTLNDTALAKCLKRVDCLGPALAGVVLALSGFFWIINRPLNLPRC